MRKHSGANKTLVIMEYDVDLVKLSVQDNGRGFQFADKTGTFVINGKFGVVGMRQRDESIGAVLIINSHVGKGTSIILEIKLSGTADNRGVTVLSN